MQYFERLTMHPSLAGIRARSAALARQFRLDRAIRAAREASAGPLPDDVVAEICRHWGDPGLTAADGYLRSLLAEAKNAHGYILQCGVDLTTLLLAVQVERRGVRLWTLESSSHAANAMRSWLDQYGLGHASIIAAPADITDAGVGYSLDAARLPGPLGLVLCEASMAHPGNARRILPHVETKLAPNAVALVRNVRRRSDFEYLSAWCRDKQGSLVVRGKTEPHAKIVLRDRSTNQSHEAARINTAFASKKNGVRSVQFSTQAAPQTRRRAGVSGTTRVPGGGSSKA
jgi:predicted O-methyltransferase YrrM